MQIRLDYLLLQYLTLGPVVEVGLSVNSTRVLHEASRNSQKKKKPWQHLVSSLKETRMRERLCEKCEMFVFFVKGLLPREREREREKRKRERERKLQLLDFGIL